MSAQPFDVSVPQETLDDLQERLARTRFPDEVSGAGWDYGANLAYLRELVDYWRDGFDWRAQEEIINGFAHFRAEIDGFGVHFLHERGKVPNPLPIILTHGWPDSFFRMLKLIPLLTDPDAACEPDHLLGDADNPLFHADLLRDTAQPAARERWRTGRGADRLCHISQRSRHRAARVGRAVLRRAALDGDAAWWPLRGDGGAGAARRGHPRLLPSLAVAFCG
jgi:hypothetical protein